MTQDVDTQRIPALTLGWRLKMALGEMTAIEMADALGVHRGTVSRWVGDIGAPPRKAYISQWALITGVSRNWLESGAVPDHHDGGGGGLSSEQPEPTQEYPRVLALVA